MCKNYNQEGRRNLIYEKFNYNQLLNKTKNIRIGNCETQKATDVDKF